MKNMNSVSPLVSVIIPVYNAGRFLRQTLDSICGQSLRDIEIILVDDGSKDDSLTIMEEYARADSRITILHQKNQYAGVARNNGIQVARGKYLSFLDADDIFEVDMLEAMFARAESVGADVVVCRADTFTDGACKRPMPWQIKDKYLEGVNRELFTPSKDVPWCVFQFLIGWSWDKLYRADYVKHFDFRFAHTRHSNDGPFVFPSIVAAQRMSIIDDKPYVHYRVHDSQLSNTGSMTKSPSSCIDSIIAIYERISSMEQGESVMGSFYCWVAHYLYWNIQQLYGDARWDLIEAVRERIEPRFKITEKLRDIRNVSDYDRLCKDAAICFDSYEYMVAPQISVTIPVYNAEPFLREALDSLLSQDFRSFEIICVNDGSTDGSLNLLREYERKDTRLRIVDVPNGGYGKAMNIGLARSVGKYFAIFEPDDILPQDAYNELWKMAEENQLDISKGCIAKFYEKGGKRIIEPDYNVQEGRVICPREYQQSYKFNMCTVTCLYNMDFLRKHDIRYNETPGASYQDNGMHMLSFSYANRLMCTKKVVYLYRVDNFNSSIHQFATKPYAMRDEFRYIRERLMETPEIWECVKGAWLYKRMVVHGTTFPKICNGIKMEYLRDLREELLPFEKFDTSLFWYSLKMEFNNLLVSPDYFMLKKMVHDEVAALNASIAKALNSPEEKRIANIVNVGKSSNSKYKWYGLPLLAARKSDRGRRYLLFGFIPIWEKLVTSNKKKYRFCGVTIYRKKF